MINKLYIVKSFCVNMQKEKIKFFSLWLSLFIIGIFIIQSIFPIFTNILVLNKNAIPQIWRFVSAIFLHGSITHLLFNLFALVFFGILLEKLIGSKRFLFLFFLSGIIANIISINFYPSSLGASGAIMGIIGALTVIKPMVMVWAFGMILPMFVAAGLWIVGDILGAMGAFGDTGIGNIAHLSGIGVGLILGLILRRNLKKGKTIKNSFEPHRDHMEYWEERHMK
jgi:uncharacterized protein